MGIVFSKLNEFSNGTVVLQDEIPNANIKLVYIPIDNISVVLPNLKAGDIIFWVANPNARRRGKLNGKDLGYKNLDFAHLGMISRPSGSKVPYFRNPSSDSGK